jgi:methylmalonyl-CoA/ethylmalonyl-CoA epimerase
MKIIRINHLGVVPKNMDVAQKFFGVDLGLSHVGKDFVADQKVSVEFYRSENTRVELLSATDESSPITKYLAEKGSGIQHVAFEVDDIQAWIDHLLKKDIKMIDLKPRKGAHNTLVAFVHPHATGGVLVELVQEM